MKRGRLSLMKGEKPVNIKKYKRKRQINIGIALFSVVLIYLIGTLITCATDKKVMAYEVAQGSILNDRFYTGLALREEKVISAKAGGYINYLQSECGKAGAGMGAYVLTSSPIPYKPLRDTAGEAAPLRKQQELAALIENFNENYSPEKFSAVYSFKNEISESLLEGSDSTKTSTIEDILKQSGMDAEVCDAPFDGIMLHYTDGYENMTFDSLKASDFDAGGYKSAPIRDNDRIKEGDPAYKLVTADKWQVIVRLDHEAAEKLVEAKSVMTRINKDREIMKAGFSILEKDGEVYGRLTYDNFMIRFAKERFLGVEIILEDVKGLKIPKSALARQDFCVMPEAYLERDKGGFSVGVNLIKEGCEDEFAPVKIYKVTPEGMAYIGMEGLSLGCAVRHPDSGTRYEIKKVEPLTGVFNLNRGYAEFKRVDILCESGDYCIVRPGDMYGIHNYDHIAQDAGSVREGEVVF